MSGGSTGQYLGYIAGAVLAYFTGGSTLTYAAVGGVVGAALDPPKGPTLTGPRINDLTVQTSTYGANIPRDYGTVGHTGNVIWLEGNRLKEVVKKKKSGGKGGGGGSTVKTYTYYATFAVGLADCRHTGPMAGVRRVWVGSKLIYNAGSDDIETIIASNQAAAGFRFYPGSTTQNPDPRMQADIGVANCPAFRGLAYIVLYDYPLADHGNSLLGAPVKVEMVGVGSGTGFRLLRSLDITNPYQIYEVMANAYKYNEPVLKYSVPYNDIRFGNGVISLKEFNIITETVSNIKNVSIPSIGWGIGIGKSDDERYMFGTDDYYPGVVGDVNYSDQDINDYGKYYSISKGVYYTIRHSSRMLAYNLDGFYLIHEYISPFDINTSSSSNAWACDATDEYIYFGVVDYLLNRVLLKYKKDGEYIGHAIVTGIADAVSVVSDDCIFFPKGYDLYLTNDFFNSYSFVGNDLGVNCNGIGNFGWTVYNNCEGLILVVSQLNGLTRIRFYQTSSIIEESDISLSEVVEYEILQSAYINGEDIDLTQLTDHVIGYRVTGTAAIRSALDPLMAVWPFDLILSGYQLKAVRRGGASLMDIPLSHLDARAAGDAIGDRLVKARDMPSQLPTRVVVQYLSAAREYDQGEQRSPDRDTGNTVNITTQSIAVVLDDEEAAGVAETLQALRWLERTDIGPFRLPPTYRFLQPADVVTLVGDGVSYEIRLTSVNLLSDGRLECSAKLNAAALYTPAAVGAVASDSGRTVGLDGPSAMQLLDIPLLRDEDDSAGFPAAMCGYTAAWPGGILYRSGDGGQVWEDLQGFAGPVPIGYARNALAAGRTDIFDSSNTLQVDLLTGDLESVSQLSALAGVNWFAFGADGRWEIIAAATCTIQPDGSWVLSDLLRGRRGSEWAMGLHQVGDALVAITDGDMAWISVATDSIGASRDYRAITVGKGIDTDTSHAWTYTAVNLKPLSPINANGSRHPTTHDWSLSWTRRGRLSPEWRDSVDMPLGEDSQAWEVDICTDATYATTVRTLSGLTSAAAAYTSAQQVADFGSNQATLYLRIVQLSATVGRGFPLQVALTR